ncbi:unnamed protein product [Rotaria magnacalcarata]|uniref:Uncharacterized protein n=1 Tax=Rotaria magnacalcarata TaxID=392030 RepID=A0A8S2QV58_9BILA|nr:unnamed protein product [Rotaria magnacalcarata]
MENVVLTSATHISPKSGSPLCSQFVPIVTDEAVTTLTIESSVENPSESVEQTETDGNFQAKMDINYQAHDVALAAAATGKSNEHEQTNGLKLNQHHKVDIDETDQHPDKVKSPCSMVNALLLVLAIVCFAIFLCAIAIILTSKPHYLTLSGSTPVSIEKGQKMEKNLTQGQFVDQLKEINNYFFKIDQPGIGKNYIATLSESETKTKLTIFADHHGIMIDTSVVTSANTNKTISDIYGIRISPRQSPVYETVSNYGPTLIVYPSQAIHTTWWRFEY